MDLALYCRGRGPDRLLPFFILPFSGRILPERNDVEDPGMKEAPDKPQVICKDGHIGVPQQGHRFRLLIVKEWDSTHSAEGQEVAGVRVRGGK
jgi:hypothetical protein